MRWRIGIASRSAYGYASAVWTLEISPIFVLSPVASIGLGPTQFLNDFEEMARRENELTNRNTSACGSLERELDGGHLNATDDRSLSTLSLIQEGGLAIAGLIFCSISPAPHDPEAYGSVSGDATKVSSEEDSSGEEEASPEELLFILYGIPGLGSFSVPQPVQSKVVTKKTRLEPRAGAAENKNAKD
ncbi:hypothetical protein GN244_ATG08797 [Phytophthora infestans]|uniref:Uncharacterized protein n=1 Tax=Phytophthora infestans TaxID=4787 RepID=A0A833WK85_PHYIN|nr:hypothetical protein GN244_ATG08797 [Phytophthora infestans]